MDFFTSSPLNRRRHTPSPSPPEHLTPPEPAPDRNLFSHYFMIRTGKLLDLTIEEQTRKFIQRVKRSEREMELQSREVHMFYSYMASKLRGFPGFSHWDVETVERVVVGMERFVMVNLTADVFNPPEDHGKDEAITEKIRSLHWILPKHLDFALPSDNETTDRQLALAQYYLLETNDKRSPHDKIACFVLCCKALNELFTVAHGSAAGADELMPMLIYTIIVAAPPNLYSTVQYIDRFLPSEQLHSGETAYHFTNIHCALQFLEAITPEKLSLSKEEYEHFMEGHSSHLEEALVTKFANGLVNNIARVKECEDKLKQLHNYQDKLKGNTEQLQVDVRKHKVDVQQSFDNLRNKYTGIEEQMAELLES